MVPSEQCKNPNEMHYCESNLPSLTSPSSVRSIFAPCNIQAMHKPLVYYRRFTTVNAICWFDIPKFKCQ